MRKNIKNYTSKDPVNVVTQKIQGILAGAGANKIMLDYDTTGNISGIIFGIEIQGRGFVPFSLPVSVEKVAQVLYKRSFNSLIQKHKDQVRRTAWKNIHDWIDAQMALIETEQAELAQIFLPYVVTGENRTLYGDYKENKLLIENK